MNISRRSSLALAGGAMSLLSGLSLSRRVDAQETVVGDAYTVALSDPRLSSWTRLIDAGGLQAYARAATQFTVFPASDAAFAGYPHLINDLLGYQSQTGSHNDAAAFPDTSKIVALVRSHVVAGKHMPEECAGKSVSFTTRAGTPLVVDGTQSPMQITWSSVVLGRPLTASLVDQPIVCSNAVIYILDRIDVA
jgi:uncharacterized surface protein with fasciclin (FAS1) repeats